MTRRLRQHNGECKGGAKYTHTSRPWKIYGYVRGFGENKSMVLKFEWWWKFMSRKEKGTSIEKRNKGLHKMLSKQEYQDLEFIKLI